MKNNVRPIKISVIIPVYNVEDYVSSCIRSVKNQTLSDIEIICVDDGSTDDSLNILREFEETDDRIHVFSQKNSGVSSARNLGISKSSGEYIIFVDGDDYIEEDLCEYVYSLITKKEADIVVFGGDIISEDTDDDYLKGANDYFTNNLNVDDAIVVNDSINALLKYKGSYPLVWNKIYKRDLVINSGGFDTELKLGEDEAFLFSVFPQAKVIIYTSRKFYHYLRNRSGSATEKIVLDFKHRAEENFKLAVIVKDSWEKLGILSEYENEYLDRYVFLLFDSAKLVDYSPSFKTEYIKRVLDFFLEAFPDFANLLLDIWIDRNSLQYQLGEKNAELQEQKNRIYSLQESNNRANVQVDTLRETISLIETAKRHGKEKTKDKPKRQKKNTNKHEFLNKISIILNLICDHGLNTYRNLKHTYGSDCVFVSCAIAGLGDAYITCRYLGSWLHENHFSNYRFLIVNKTELKMIEAFYPHIGERCVPITVKQHEWLRNMDTFLGGITDFYFFHHYDYMQPHLQIADKLQGYRNISMTDLYLWKMGLPLDSECEKPQFANAKSKEIDELFIDNGLAEGKTVILSPYSTCLGTLPVDFWTGIAEKLKDFGYSVCTNCGTKEQKPIPGTKGIYVPFESLIYFVEKCGFFIGIRSGLCDIISTAKCQMSIVYPYESKQWGDGNGISYVGMKEMLLREDTNEYELTKENRNIRIIQKEILNEYSNN